MKDALPMTTVLEGYNIVELVARDEEKWSLAYMGFVESEHSLSEVLQQLGEASGDTTTAQRGLGLVVEVVDTKSADYIVHTRLLLGMFVVHTNKGFVVVEKHMRTLIGSVDSVFVVPPVSCERNTLVDHPVFDHKATPPQTVCLASPPTSLRETPYH